MTNRGGPDDSERAKGSPVKILIVEDEEAHIELIKRGFSGRHEEVALTVAMTLGSAKAGITKDPPDLILADWLLPDGKGAELITSMQGVPVIPVVIMTSHGNEQIAVDVMKSGAIDYIVKSEATFAEMPHISTRALRQWRTMRDHARAEVALASTLERLNEAQRLAHIGTWDWIVENDTVTWSGELYIIAGRDPSKPAPTYAEHPHLYTPDSWDHLSHAVSIALTTGEPYDLELELVRPDGSIRWINAFGGVKRDGTGKITGLLGTLQDITDRKKSEEQVLKALVQIERDLEEMALFNDQIRNPLAVIIALLDMEPDSATTTRIRKQVHMIDELINTLDRQYSNSEKVREFLRKHDDFSNRGADP